MELHGQTISVLIFFVLLNVKESQSQEKQCPRDKSRTVASVVRERLLPAFNKLQVDVSSTCPFSVERDMYATQEDKKIIEGSSRITCDFCGKSFISEFYLDNHFDNRHTDKVQRDRSVCLADNCDVFRCEIISGSSIPDFWDIALCLEDDMVELNSQCEALIDLCVPKGLTSNETTILKNELKENVCSFLTCTKFWNTPFEKTESTYMALYVVLAALTTFGIIIYMFIFYNYFYTDLLGPPPYDPTVKHRNKMRPYPGHRRSQHYTDLMDPPPYDPTVKHRNKMRPYPGHRRSQH